MASKIRVSGQVEGAETEGTDDQIALEEQPSIEVLTDILSQLSAAQIKDIMNSVFDEMLGDMKVRKRRSLTVSSRMVNIIKSVQSTLFCDSPCQKTTLKMLILRGGAGRKTVLLIFQPTHFIVHLL